MSSYESLTTVGVQHPLESTFVEIILLKQYKSLPQYPWRIKSGVAKRWKAAMSLLRHLVKSEDIAPEELLDLIMREKIKPEQFTWSCVGLIKWNIRNTHYRRVIVSDILDDFKREYQSSEEITAPAKKRKVKSIKDLMGRKNA